MKRILLTALLFTCALGIAQIKEQGPRHQKVKAGSSITFTYTGASLKPGNVQVVLIGEHGERLAANGFVKVSGNAVTLTFASPAKIGEWKVYYVQAGDDQVKLDSFFEVSQ